MINRDISPYLMALAKQFPVVAIMGPRQSGKTTLSKLVFPNYAYVSMENLDIRAIATEDPRNFLSSFDSQDGVIIDEIQEAPLLLSYMQEIVDTKNRPGFFIVTGSQNFLLHEKITQTLAGRIALLTLLPLSINELKNASMLPNKVDELMLKGGYPRLYSQVVDYGIWASNYITTYVEKDVRQVLKINDVIAFQRFIKVCAARVGNIINYADIARGCDISLNTAKSWIAVLESSYIIKLVYPYFRNFNKRVIKSPKLYFYDTGLVCALLGIKNVDELNIHPMRGYIFESMVMSEIFKYNFNHSIIPSIFFWRDVQGHEIDCIIEKSFDFTVPIEIKSSMTVSKDFFKGLIDWANISGQTVDNKMSYVVYAGKENLTNQYGQIFTWTDLNSMLNKIY